MPKHKKSIIRRLFLFSFFFSMILSICFVFIVYKVAFRANVNSKQNVSLYIHRNWNYDSLTTELKKKNLLKHARSFYLIARIRHLPANIHSGRYIITPKMSNWNIVQKLRSGEQDPVEVTFNNIRDKKELSVNISHQLEIDSTTFLQLLNNEDFVKKFGFNKQNILCMFLPNTYEFYWNTNGKKFFGEMASEYKKFWTKSRIAKAKEIGLDQSQVSVLASIVKAEQSVHKKEWPRIAGLYINRLHRGMPLQSDPTVIYAIGNYSIRRVLNKQKEIPSPYNTYLHKGLPPGPINIPPISAIKAVLNYEHNDFLYMCAKADFSGYHHFSSTLKSHLEYAKKYQAALNRMDIMK